MFREPGGHTLEFDHPSINALARVFDCPPDDLGIAPVDWDHYGITPNNFLASSRSEEFGTENYKLIVPLSVAAYDAYNAGVRVAKAVDRLKHGISNGLELMSVIMKETEDENKANVFKTLDPTP
jgi:hypothetical protein